MTPAAPSYISVVEPVSPAVAWTKRMLFQPFDLAKWFTIGFCAWLAYLAEGGGGGGGFNFHVPGGNANMGREVEQARDFVAQNLYWIIPVAIGVVLFFIALGVVLTWVSSRGQFMFLDCVVRDKAVIAEPWSVYSRQGNSLFIFRLLLGFGGLLLLVLPIAAIVLSVVGLTSGHHGGVPAGWILLLIASALITVVLGVILGIIGKLTKDFVVPIMYLRRCGWVQGWSECARLVGAHVGTFVLYLLFQIVLHIAIGLMVLAAMIVTCCIAGCLFALPYIGTVLMLPLLVFLRAYTNLYLAQFGPDYSIFNHTVRPSPAPPTVY